MCGMCQFPVANPMARLHEACCTVAPREGEWNRFCVYVFVWYRWAETMCDGAFPAKSLQDGNGHPLPSIIQMIKYDLSQVWTSMAVSCCVCIGGFRHRLLWCDVVWLQNRPGRDPWQIQEHELMPLTTWTAAQHAECSTCDIFWLFGPCRILLASFMASFWQIKDVQKFQPLHGLQCRALSLSNYGGCFGPLGEVGVGGSREPQTINS